VSKLFLPYVADVKVAGEWQRDLDVTRLNAKTAWVTLKNGDQIKLHAVKDRHKFVIKYVKPDKEEVVF
jgi:hypothetical protein